MTIENTVLTGGPTTGDAAPAAAGAATGTTPAAAPTTQATAANGAPASGDAGKSSAQDTPAAGSEPTPAKAADGTTTAEGAKPTTLGAPESYQFKAPEGKAFDDVVIGELSSVAKELDLSQHAAQTLVDRLAPKIAERQVAANTQALVEASTKWEAESRADKEFGGDAFEANLGIAKQGLDQFGTPALKSLLRETGLGNNPEILRAFYRAGKLLQQDTFVPGGKRPGGSDRSAADILYGNSSH